jgi:hypothetical protein
MSTPPPANPVPTPSPPPGDAGADATPLAHDPPTSGRITRRSMFVGLAGSVGLAAFVAACSSGDEPADQATGQPPVPPSGTGSSTESNAVSGDGPVVVQRFPQQVSTPGRVRLPISLADATGTLQRTGPAELRAQVVDVDGGAVGSPISAVRRDAEPAPYYAFVATVEAPGVYYLVVDGVSAGPEVSDGPTGAAFQVFDPADVAVPSPGEVLPPFDTPTLDDARGVDPVCTRDPEPCPFHDMTLGEALASGRPVAYYVGTPAFCSTGSCAPGLESLIEISSEFPDVAFVHAEVYADDTATTVAPAVDELGLFYEPTVFITDADGVIVDRVDSVWNTDELREIVTAATG